MNTFFHSMRFWIRSAVILGGLLMLSGCAAGERSPLRLRAPNESSELLISGTGAVGELRLWTPEGVLSENGGSSIYPIGGAWRGDERRLVQDVAPDKNFGPGNARVVDERTLECAGISFPDAGRVAWRATVSVKGNEVRFRIRLTNAGSGTIRKAGAPICLKFLNGEWWSPERVWVRSQGKVLPLAELGEVAGEVEGFEAYLLNGQSFDNIFYHRWWGFHPRQVDVPAMVTQHPESGQCVEIRAERAYFVHSNRINPCTDVMLAFGDLEPGQTAESAGTLRIINGRTPAELLAR